LGIGADRVRPLPAPRGRRCRRGRNSRVVRSLSGMIFSMSNWNISGDTLTVEPRERRSPTRWLHQHSLRIAVVLGLAEAVFAWAPGHRILLMVIGVLAVVTYLNVRHRLPEVIRRPLWIVVMAQ